MQISLSTTKREHEHAFKSEDSSDQSDLYNATPQPRAFSRATFSRSSNPSLSPVVALAVSRAAPSPAPNAVQEDQHQSRSIEHPLRQPLAIRRLPPIRHSLQIPENPRKFAWKFLQQQLKGSSVRPCYFCGINPTSLAKTYFAINRQHEPYLPVRPGEHGSKLTNSMVPLEDESIDTPLFIGEAQKGVVRYTYFRNYRYPHWSDRLDYDRLVEDVPLSIRRWHAYELCRRSRPAWLHNAMKEYFWSLPKIGEIAPELQIQVIEGHNEEADEWMETITEEMILKFFEEPDFGGDRLTLRLAWEYFECVGYDQMLYNRLVQEQDKAETITIND